MKEVWNGNDNKKHKTEEERIKGMDEYIGVTNISVIGHKVLWTENIKHQTMYAYGKNPPLEDFVFYSSVDCIYSHIYNIYAQGWVMWCVKLSFVFQLLLEFMGSAKWNLPEFSFMVGIYTCKDVVSGVFGRSKIGLLLARSNSFPQNFC